MKSKYGLNGYEVLDLIAKDLHPYKGKWTFETKRELSDRNKILHVIRRIAGRTTFQTAWNFIRKGKLNRVYGQKEKIDLTKKLFFYSIERKKEKKAFYPRVLIFLPNTCHCTCLQYKRLFKKKRYVTVCCHLLAILLAKALDLWPEKSKFASQATVKLILHAKMKHYKFNIVNFHKMITDKFKTSSVRKIRPSRKKKKKKGKKEKKEKKIKPKKKVKKTKKVKK